MKVKTNLKNPRQIFIRQTLNNSFGIQRFHGTSTRFCIEYEIDGRLLSQGNSNIE